MKSLSYSYVFFLKHMLQARNQDFMWGGGDRDAYEVKVDQTTEMYFLLSDPFTWESSNTWEIVTAKYVVRTEYFTTIAANVGIWLANLPLLIRVHSTLLASMGRAMPSSTRALKKETFLWR